MQLLMNERLRAGAQIFDRATDGTAEIAEIGCT